MNRNQRAEAQDRAIARFGELKRDEKWTQQTLADETGMSLRTVSDFLNKKAVANRDTLVPIFKALGLRLDAAAERDSWPDDVKAFLDIMGIYLKNRPPEKRAEITRSILERYVGGSDDSK